MKGIKIGKHHTWKDWGLYLQKISIDLPLRKEQTISVLGMNGKLDLSEALTGGEARYENRMLVFSFEFADGSYEEMLSKVSVISNAINGKRLQIILDEDPRFFYEGTVQVKTSKINSMVSSLDIAVEADPYKYDVFSSTEDWLWDSFSFQTGIIFALKGLSIEDSTVLIHGINEVSVIPVIVVKEMVSQMTLVYGDKVYSLKVGRNRFPQVKVGNGEVSLRFTGEGTVDIEFRRRSQ